MNSVWLPEAERFCSVYIYLTLFSHQIRKKKITSSYVRTDVLGQSVMADCSPWPPTTPLCFPYRNLSSASQQTRQKMRECHGLVDSMVNYISSSLEVGKSEDKVLAYLLLYKAWGSHRNYSGEALVACVSTLELGFPHSCWSLWQWCKRHLLVCSLHWD